MSLSSEEAKKQIIAEFDKAGVEMNTDMNSIINEQFIQKIQVLGKREKFHEPMAEAVVVSLDRILENNKELGPHAEKICQILEELAPSPKAKNTLQVAFAPTKAQYMVKEAGRIFEESLNLVQENITELVKNKNVRDLMGDANADKLADIAQKMNDNLKGAKDNSKNAEILGKGIGEMQKFVENAEKQASKGEFGKVMNVLKSALKVIGTLGLNKNAKLELAAAKFAMDNQNANKIKTASKTISSNLAKSTKGLQVPNQEQATNNTRAR